MNRHCCSGWTHESHGVTFGFAAHEYVGLRRHANGAAAARARIEIARILQSRLVEKWKSDATSPSPRNNFASYRPPSQPSTGPPGRWTVWLAFFAPVRRALPAVTSFPKCNSRARCRCRARARPSTSKVPNGMVSRAAARPRDAPARGHRRHRAARLSPRGDAATSARRRCSPAIASSCSSMVRAPTGAMFAAIEQARDYVLVESFIFEEAASGDRHAERAAGAGRAPRRARLRAVRRGRLAHHRRRSFSTGLGDGRHLAVRLQSAESARQALLRRQSARPSQDRRGRRRTRVRGRHQFQPGVPHRVQPGAAPRTVEAEIARIKAGATRTSPCVAPARSELERLFRDDLEQGGMPGRGDRRHSATQAVERGQHAGADRREHTRRREQRDLRDAALRDHVCAARASTSPWRTSCPTMRSKMRCRTPRNAVCVVRIILPSYSDFSGVFYAGRAHYHELLDSGVKLYELESAFLHSKSIVVDGVWSSIGSTNFDWRSFVHNNEISVCVIDRGVRAVDDARCSPPTSRTREEITLAAWKKRGLQRAAAKNGCGCRSSIGCERARKVGRSDSGHVPRPRRHRFPDSLRHHAQLPAVAIGVARQHALDAVPGRADGLLGIDPGELRLALGDVPAGLQARLEVLEARVRILLIRLVRIAIRRDRSRPSEYSSL